MIEIDAKSKLVLVDGDSKIFEVIQYLEQQSYLLPYYPMGLKTSNATTKITASVNECLANNYPNLYSNLYGELADLCAGYNFDTVGKKQYVIDPYPRAATGPSLKNLLIGSQKKLGRFDKVYLHIHDLPEAKIHFSISYEQIEKYQEFDLALKRAGLFYALKYEDIESVFFIYWGNTELLKAQSEIIQRLALQCEVETENLEDEVLIEEIINNCKYKKKAPKKTKLQAGEKKLRELLLHV